MLMTATSNETGGQREMGSKDDSKNRRSCLFSSTFTSSSLSLQSTTVSCGQFAGRCGLVAIHCGNQSYHPITIKYIPRLCSSSTSIVSILWNIPGHCKLTKGAITFFPGERFRIPRIPTFTERFRTISHKWTLAQTLTTDPIPNWS